MKKRNGFVSNSSSSSFIINLGASTIDELEHFMDFNVDGEDYDITVDDIYNKENIISHLKSSFEPITLFELKLKGFWKDFEKQYYWAKPRNEEKLADISLYYKDNDAFLEKYKAEIEAYDVTGSEEDNLYIGDMDDHHPIERLIHNNDISINCFTVVISNH